MPAKHADYTVTPEGDCTRCGQRHWHPQRNLRTCDGHAKTRRLEDGTIERLDTERPCLLPPSRGFTRCTKHGISKKMREKAQQRAKIEKLAVTLGEPVEADPGEIVAQRIAARNGHVQWLLARVRELEPEALTWGRTKEKSGGDDYGTTEEAKPHIWYTLYIEAARDLERLCIEAIRAGLEERRVRLAEQQGAALVRFIDGVLTDLGHDPNNPETADVVARHLQAVA